jgi:hypothetical protein
MADEKKIHGRKTTKGTLYACICQGYESRLQGNGVWTYFPVGAET